MPGCQGPDGSGIGDHHAYEAWAEVLAANTIGPMRVSEAFVEHVARSNRKLIVTDEQRPPAQQRWHYRVRPKPHPVDGAKIG